MRYMYLRVLEYDTDICVASVNATRGKHVADEGGLRNNPLLEYAVRE